MTASAFAFTLCAIARGANKAKAAVTAAVNIMLFISSLQGRLCKTPSRGLYTFGLRTPTAVRQRDVTLCDPLAVMPASAISFAILVRVRRVSFRVLSQRRGP